MSTLGSTPLESVSLYIAPAGGWRGDVVLHGGTDLPVEGSAVTLTVGDLVLHGGVERALNDAPDRPHVVVVGGLGWQALVARPLSFQSSAGVRLSTALDAIARGAGMTIAQPTDATIGDYFEVIASRPGELVRWVDVLADLVRGGYIESWRVDPDGVTRFGPRAALAVSSRATVLRRDASDGSVTYGLDAPAQFLPGHTIDGVPIGRIKIRETRGKLEADVWPATDAAPSIREQLHKLVAPFFADMDRTYLVAAVHADGTLDLTSPPDAPHIPEMKHVEQWVMGGSKFKPAIGTPCRMVFRDVRKTRPIVTGFKLDAGAYAPTARVGDTVAIYFPPSMPIAGTITGVGAFTGLATVPGPGIGTIQTGSTKDETES